jgi:hypothetical protein
VWTVDAATAGPPSSCPPCIYKAHGILNGIWPRKKDLTSFGHRQRARATKLGPLPFYAETPMRHRSRAARPSGPVCYGWASPETTMAECDGGVGSCETVLS